MRDLTTKSQGTFGLPKRWKFDYPWSMVKLAFGCGWYLALNVYQLSKVMAYDPRWITDMQLHIKSTRSIKLIHLYLRSCDRQKTVKVVN